MLSIRLSKFIAKRNVSFNCEFVFIKWQTATEEWKKINENRIQAIADLRSFVKTNYDNVKEDDRGTAANTNSEGKTTDEAEVEKKSDVKESSKDKDAKKKVNFNDGEDHDQDIIMPKEEAMKLIPNCFGVYKPN